MASLGLLVCVFLLFAGLAGATPPVMLEKETFKESIESGPHFVKFFAPWCGHCKRLAPTWDELSEKFTDSGVTIAKVDCTEQTALCAEHGVRGYPTLKFFQDGGDESYQGARDIQSLADFVSSRVGTAEAVEQEEEEEEEEQAAAAIPGVVELTTDTFQSEIEQGMTFVKFYAPWCGHCKRLAPTWDELAERIHASSEDTVIAKVDCTVEKQLCSDHGVRGYPTLILFQDGEKKSDYKQARDLDTLLQFINENS